MSWQLPVDAEAAEEWGRMSVPDPVSIVDGLMAVTAKVRNMTFAVTRNTADVARTGVRLLNPFDRSSRDRMAGETHHGRTNDDEDNRC